MSAEPVPYLRDPAFRQLLQDIRETDNLSNWYYIIRTWLFLAAVLALAVYGLEWVAASGVGWGWAIPIVIGSALLVGAGQHHLGVLGHEGSHHTLFRNRTLNELASDWLCMYPLFTTTYMYRLQHLAHHQFVNDPDRDPNVYQMRATDTWPAGPLRPRQVLGYVLGLFAPARLFGFLRVRIRDNSFTSSLDVYRCSDGQPAPWPKRIGALCVVGQFALNLALPYTGNRLLLAVLPGALFVLSVVVFAVLPARLFHRSRVKPEMSLRVTTLHRFTCYFLLFHGLAWATVLTGRPVMWYFVLLWVIPLLTVFPLLVLLRQFVQHSNGGRGRLNNTRVFLGPQVMNFFVMPVGQDYHLPHHLFATIPHFRLRQLHEALMKYPDYRAEAVEVDGVIRPHSGHPTVLDVLGAADEPVEQERFIDSEVLDDYEVTEREAIAAEEEASARSEPTPTPPRTAPDPSLV